MLKTLIALIFAAFALPAQEQPPGPAVVVQFLGFSDSQTAQFQGLLQSLQSSVGPLEQQAAAAQQALEQSVSSDNPDPAAIGGRVLAIRAIQKQILAVLDSYHQRFAALLTTDQLQKVQAVTQAGALMPVVNAFAQVQLIRPPQ